MKINNVRIHNGNNRRDFVLPSAQYQHFTISRHTIEWGEDEHGARVGSLVDECGSGRTFTLIGLDCQIEAWCMRTLHQAWGLY